MTIQITRPEVESLINQRLQSGGYKDAEDVILHALQMSEGQRGAAIERLRTFGKTNGLSLGEVTIRELRDQARP
jgi:hypothetical protein